MTTQRELDHSNALVGQGNVAHQKGDYGQALVHYLEAIDHYPSHIYAWHDIVVVCIELARQGQPNLDLMRAALDAVKTLEASNPTLGAKQVGKLEAALARVEASGG